MISAPPAIPPCNAIHPAWRPITSTTMTRLMAGRRSVQPIQRVHHDINGRIKTEGRRRGFEIVVDRLRDADAVDAGLLQLLRGDQRAVAANNDQCFYLELVENFSGVCDDVRWHNCAIARADFRREMAAIGRADELCRPAP